MTGIIIKLFAFGGYGGSDQRQSPFSTQASHEKAWLGLLGP